MHQISFLPNKKDFDYIDEEIIESFCSSNTTILIISYVSCNVSKEFSFFGISFPVEIF